MNTIAKDAVPSATPSDEEIAAWKALPRDEQVRRTQQALAHADCSKIGTATMDELRERGRTHAAKRRNG